MPERQHDFSRGFAMAPQDAARLHMGTPGNPMVIAAALLLDGPIGRDAVAQALADRLLPRQRRFRQRVVEPRSGWGAPRWVEEQAIDAGAHCIARSVDESDAALEGIIGERLSAPLDPRRALWEACVVDRGGARAAVVFRLHHVLADGEALVEVLRALADEGAREDRGTMEATPEPGRGPRVLQLLGGVASAARLALHPPDPATILHGRPGPHKRVAFSSPLRLDALAASARALDTTVTGLLLAAVAGALRAALGEEGASAAPVLHALVPVSAHAGGVDAASGNRFASVLVPLPVGAADPVERVLRAKDGLRAARARGGLRAGAHLVGAAGAATAAIERAGVTLYSRKATAVVSSVRGPPCDVHLCGATVSDILAWAPPPGTIALAFTLMSYAGGVRVGVLADAQVIGDPRPLLQGLERELAGFHGDCGPKLRA
jgi:WS/DGAT/MGAT family acyltransferase